MSTATAVKYLVRNLEVDDILDAMATATRITKLQLDDPELRSKGRPSDMRHEGFQPTSITAGPGQLLIHGLMWGLWQLNRDQPYAEVTITYPYYHNKSDRNAVTLTVD